MDGTRKKNELPAKDERKKSKKSTPAAENHDEDGDIATPKRDRSGDDDQPL
jgi:hypothetical protein